MNFSQLKDFLLLKMSMSHIYQPLVIRSLLESSGKSSVRDLAREFLSYDEAQVEYYCKVVKRWPKATLARHGVIDASERGYFKLALDVTKLTQTEKEDLIKICNEKIQSYINSYSGIIGDYRYNPDDLSSSSIRYLVLKLAKGRCALCGASIKDTPLDIDHIVPRNKGGTNDLSNLQALCFRCNRAKRDRDSEDFRRFGQFEPLEGCAFCERKTEAEQEYNSCLWIWDRFPVSAHHSLIIPKRHVSSVSELSVSEMQDMFLLMARAKARIQEIDADVRGFNIGFNDGACAGQTIMHTHMHLIPRRNGDVEQPRGGIRGVIPGMAVY
jgi:ATP adenylyltransferase